MRTSLIFILLVFTSSLFASEVKLSAGKTYYKLIDKKAKVNVVLIHGGAFSSWTWLTTASPLASKGYNVLKYDLYGMGKSESLLIREYDRHIFLRQLTDLLKHVGWHKSKKPLYIIGSSIGASIGAMYAARYRRTVKKMVFLTPAYNVRATTGLFGKLATNWMNGFPESRILRRKLKREVRKRADKFIRSLPNKKRKLVKTFIDKEVDSTQYIDSLYRRLISNVFMSYSGSYRHVGNQKIPVLMFYGDKDSELPDKHVRALKRRIRKNFTVINFVGAGPEYTVTESKLIKNKIIEFLR